MIYIELLFMLICSIAYFRQNYLVFLLTLITLVSNFYYFFSIDNNMAFKFYTNLMVIFICFVSYLQSNNFFDTTYDKIGKCIKLVVIYYFMHAIISIIFHIETPINALKVFGAEAYLLAYFLFRKISIENLNVIKKMIFIIAIIGAVLYYLQFLGFHTLSGGAIQENFIESQSRYANVPYICYIVLLYLVFAREDVKNNTLWILFLLPLVILPMVRGFILGFIISLAFTLYLSKNFDLIKKYILPFALVGLIFSSFIETRFEGKSNSGGFINEIKNAFNMSSSSNFEFQGSDTFTFRIALAMERLEYMAEHPQTYLTGVGSIYESIETTNKFDFIIGSTGADPQGNFYRRQIDTTDISFITHFFRYGILYLVFIFFFIFFLMRELLGCRFYSSYYLVVLTILIEDLIQCLSSVPFYDFSINRMFPLLLIAGVLNNTYNSDQHVEIIKI